MESGRPSETALRAARLRARHQCHDRPPVLEDPIALRIVGEHEAAQIRSGAVANDFVARVFRGGIVGRSRIAEDTLHAAVQRGVRQYVVLGAGLDTFAYRNPHADLRVFEVDHPDTQAWKRRLLDEARIDIPPSLRFAELDLQTGTLADSLRAAGLDTREPAFFSLLGVTQYVDQEAVMQTLRFIAQRMPTGSAVAFDCIYRPSRLNLPGRWILHRLSRRYARIGEPWITFFDRRALVETLREIGFAKVEAIGTREINERLFSRRGDGLKVRGGRLGGMIVATL